jgi:predicted phage tail protein
METTTQSGTGVRENVREKWNDVKSQASDWTESARERAHEAQERAGNVVRENPATAVSIAAAVGAVLGYAVVSAALPKASAFSPRRSMSSLQSRGASWIEDLSDAVCSIRDAADKAIARFR